MKLSSKCAIILAGLALGALGVLVTSRLSPANAIDSRFVGFTNGLPRAELAMKCQPLALLAVTNRTDRTIVLAYAPPQIQRDGRWPKQLHMARTYVGSVPGHHERIFSVPAEQTEQPWRIPIVWGFEPSKLAAHLAVLAWRCRAAVARQPLPGPDVAVHTNFSEVISSKPVYEIQN